MDSRPILIFDGYCSLCNSTVDFILRKEKRAAFLFTANQDPAGQRLLAQFGENPADLTTVFLVEKGKIFKESTAALRLVRYLRFPWFLLYAFIVVPPFLRNAVYRWVSRNRYRWFGQKESCRIPTPEERARFLVE